MSAVVTGNAAAAAAAKAAQEREEEEQMSSYPENDINNDWEFKILRSTMSGFGNPETLKRVVEEEAQNGWVLIEKFDNYRLRFKRKRSNTRQSEYGVDAYRSYYGSPSAYLAFVIVAIAFIFTAIFIIAAIISTSNY